MASRTEKTKDWSRRKRGFERANGLLAKKIAVLTVSASKNQILSRTFARRSEIERLRSQEDFKPIVQILFLIGFYCFITFHG